MWFLLCAGSISVTGGDVKADIFFVRMLPLSNEIHNYINSLPKANPLTKAIERKIQK
jgi:hypothetical protein